MKRAAIVVFSLWCLACAGITEKAVEITTGGSMEIAPNGDVTMTMPDGSKVTTQQNGQPPEGWPLPEPWTDAKPQALVTNTAADGKTNWILTYELAAPRDEIVAVYSEWLEANAKDVQHQKQNTAGMVSETWVAGYGDGQVLVTITEAFGANSVSVIWAPDGMIPKN